jgi:hypothetical protein
MMSLTCLPLAAISRQHEARWSLLPYLRAATTEGSERTHGSGSEKRRHPWRHRRGATHTRGDAETVWRPEAVIAAAAGGGGGGAIGGGTEGKNGVSAGRADRECAGGEKGYTLYLSRCIQLSEEVH